MSSAILKGQWKKLRGEIKKRWGKLTDDELDQVEGEWDKFVALIQLKYGYTKEQAEARIADLVAGQEE